MGMQHDKMDYRGEICKEPIIDKVASTVSLWATITEFNYETKQDEPPVPTRIRFSGGLAKGLIARGVRKGMGIQVEGKWGSRKAIVDGKPDWIPVRIPKQVLLFMPVLMPVRQAAPSTDDMPDDPPPPPAQAKQAAPPPPPTAEPPASDEAVDDFVDQNF